MSRHAAKWSIALAAALSSVATAQTFPPPGECPQPRFTESAPADYLSRRNPVTADAAAGARLYGSETSNTVSCATCHGVRGDGKGEMAKLFNPPPRNFACARTIHDVPDGQLFWIIRYGSPGTSMPGHARLKDEEVWQLVHHLRKLAR